MKALKLALIAGLFAIGLSVAVPAPAHASEWVRVYNETDDDIVSVNISYNRDDNWEDNRLSQPLSAGYNQLFYVRQGVSCRVDLRAVLADGNHAERYNVDVCAGFNWHLTN